MGQGQLDLISMADIARLAGQSRATVGNWKARNPDDFPPEQGRSSRGPLYDRAEVTDWLTATERLDERPPEVVAVWQLADDLRHGMTTEEAMQMGLVLLAIMATSSEEWQTIRTSRADRIDAAIRAVVHSQFPYAEELLPSASLPHASVACAVETLSTMDSSLVAAMTDALLEQAAQTLGYRGGEYLTPASIRRLMVALTGPTGTVYNPASGIGQLLTHLATESETVTSVVGQEINHRVWAMAQLNLAIHGVQAMVALGDVFTADAFPDLRADRVVAVPPWGHKLSVLDKLHDDPRWIYGEPGPNDGNAAWIQHCLYHLADGGRAVLVLPNGVLFEGGRSGRMRQRMVKAGLLDAVIALPPGLFPGAGVAGAILIFVKGRPSVHGKPAPTLMIDVSEMSEDHVTRSPRLLDSTIDRIVTQYRDWSEQKKIPTSGSAAVASFEELAVNDFVLAPARYLALSQPSVTLNEAIMRRSELATDFSRLVQESADADKQLAKILEIRR
jgi:type I restriction enzyme M protein